MYPHDINEIVFLNVMNKIYLSEKNVLISNNV